MTEHDKDGEDIWKTATFANAVASLIQNKHRHIEMITAMAELRWAKYNALIEAGFSKEDVLFIIVNTGIME